ncbi:MAG TPA: hypothetical protein VIK91_05980, partial [Nannocystis sp.]
ALLQHTTPGGGLVERFSRDLGRALKIPSYMRATSSVQSWAMFAPNPHRTNQFLQVRVVTADGQEIDLRHDIYGQRNYPYFFYDRMGKINRRLLEQDRYQVHYAAWVCREWALTHGGEAPVRVNFTKMWTRVPPPSQAIRTMGFDPYELELHKEDLPGHDCATTVHAQLPNEIRARHGLPLLPPGAFIDLEEPTWYDKARARAAIIERRRAAEASKKAKGKPAARKHAERSEGRAGQAEAAAERAEPAEPDELAAEDELAEGGAAAEGGE